MFTYNCPVCKVTTQTEQNLIRIDENNISINKKREEINKEIDRENEKIQDEFNKEMEKVKKEIPNEKTIKEMKVFSGDKDGYSILKIDRFVPIEVRHPKIKNHINFLPTKYVECPVCDHKEYIWNAS